MPVGRQSAPRLGNWSYGQGRCACLTPTTLLLVEAAHPPRGLVELVFSFSSEPFGLRFTVDYSSDFFSLVGGLSNILFNSRPSRLWLSILRAVLTPAQTISESRQSTLGYGIASAVPHLDSARLDYRGPAHRVRQSEPGTVRWLPLLASKRQGREKYPIEKRPGFGFWAAELNVSCRDC